MRCARFFLLSPNEGLVMVRAGGTTLRAWALYLALTIPTAVLGHLLFDVIESGCTFSVLLRPQHIVLAALLVAALAAALYGLGAGLEPAERRRRRALFAAALGTGRSYVLGAAASVGLQLALVATTLRLDGTVLRADHLAVALVASLVAVVAGALAFRIARRRLAGALVTFFRRADTTPRANRARSRRAVTPHVRGVLRILRSAPHRAPPRAALTV